MNELMVCFGDGGYIYYNTDATEIDKATREWARIMDRAGMNIDNLVPTYACLRDNHDNNIDETDDVRW